MVSTLEQVLQPIIGTYNYSLAPLRNGLDSLDYGYICRFIILCIGLIMTFQLINKIVSKMFGVTK